MRAISPGQTKGSDLKLVRRSQPLLGTFVTISVYAPQTIQANFAIDEAFQAFQHADRMMSVHRQDSELSHLNSRAANEQVQVSPELFQVLYRAHEIAQLTEGSFDLTIGPLTQLWGFIWKEYRLPTQAELQRVLPLLGYQKLELFPNGSVHFKKPGMFLDLGGIGKGVAVDMATEVLMAHGIPAAMVKAGGDLRVYGTPPNQPGWTVQLEDPGKEGNRARVLLKDAALSTSGNYENFFIVDKKLYSHILNPKTGLPVEGVAACTAIAKTCTESDAWATALFVVGPEQALQKFSGHFPVRFSMMPTRKGGEFKVRASANFPQTF